MPGTWLNVCPGLRIPCDGQISSWNFYSILDDGSEIYLSVWRRSTRAGATDRDFQLVGYNLANATRIGQEIVQIPKEERITVRQGDFLGIFYEQADLYGVIPFVSSRTPGNFAQSDFQDCVDTEIYRTDILRQVASRGDVNVNGPAVSRLYGLQAEIIRKCQSRHHQLSGS